MRKLAKLLLGWYTQYARNLPWRDLRDPYAIWISEIMLQQTRVETVIPYFKKWMEIFPGISDLAKASESEVLSAWEGLGYYNRARSLRSSAHKIMKEYDGNLPENLKDLMKLPGIGRYTAGAIASIAFNQNVTTLDGNIRRVFSRIFDIDEIVNSPEGEKALWDLLERELPFGNASAFNQALMDLGATICSPKSPQCEICPVITECLARKNGTEQERPILKTKLIQEQFTYLCTIIQKGDDYLLTKRPSSGLLGGLWEFPNERIVSEESDHKELLVHRISSKLGMEVEIDKKYGIIKHAYTHFRQTMHIYNCKWIASFSKMPDQCNWVSRTELLNYPMGKVARQISREIIKDGK